MTLSQIWKHEAQRITARPHTERSESPCRRQRASQAALVVKEPPAKAGDTGTRLDPGSGRPPGGGHGNPPQCSCRESPMDRGAWRATTAHGVVKSRT